MSLANRIKEYTQNNKSFIMADLYAEFGGEYEKHSIRARVYESNKLVRVARGKYILAGSELEAIIEQSDARAIFEIKKTNIYYDMMFFDVPYFASGQKGGNRNLSDFGLISPEEFQKILYETQKMLRTEDSQIYFIIADGKSSQKDAQKYVNAFNTTSLKQSGLGSYIKLTKSGKVCNMGKYDMPPEKIMAFSHSGKTREIENVEHNLDFRLQRPPLPVSGGYKTQKPLEMLKSLIAQSTKKGEWILDLFGGSGVSLEAALELKRKIHIFDIADEAILNHILPRARKFALEKVKISNPTLFDFAKIA